MDWNGLEWREGPFAWPLSFPGTIGDPPMTIKAHSKPTQKVAILTADHASPVWRLTLSQAGIVRRIEFHDRRQAFAFADRNGFKILLMEHARDPQEAST